MRANITNEYLRYIRRGYYKLHKEPASDKIVDSLNKREKELYYSQGKSDEVKERVFQGLGYLAAIIFVIGVWSYIVIGSNARKDHFNAIVPVDTCKVMIEKIRLFSDSLKASSFAPEDLTTEFEGNTSSCNAFVKGEDGDEYYEAFITAEVTKLEKRQEDTTKTAEAKLITSDPYPVYKWSAKKNFYSLEVSLGIDPAKTNYDDERQKLTLELMGVVAGAGLSDVPENANVKDI